MKTRLDVIFKSNFLLRFFLFYSVLLRSRMFCILPFSCSLLHSPAFCNVLLQLTCPNNPNYQFVGAASNVPKKPIKLMTQEDRAEGAVSAEIYKVLLAIL
jgi:hypothetical protein